MELDSALNKGQLTLDPTKIGTSIYEMSIVGGVFGATGLAAGRISAGSRGASDSLLSKGTVAFEKDSAHTMGDGAKVEPDFNIFTAPRVKPSVFQNFSPIFQSLEIG